MPVPAETTPDAPSIDSVQEAVTNVATVASPAMGTVLGSVVSTLGVVALLLAAWEWLKRLKELRTGSCTRCGSHKEGEGVPCVVCRGEKTLEKEVKVPLECSHCRGSGFDGCHECGGKGVLKGGVPCAVCGGVGVFPDKVCCKCEGKKELTVTKTASMACPLCGEE